MAERIAVFGAGGTMGGAMASNLLEAGFEVTAWNRTPGRARPLEGQGARVTEQPADATAGAEILLTMLSDAEAVLDATREALGGLADDAAWIQCSTIGERGTERCQELAREHDVAFFDCPVLGTKAPAQEGQLVVLASGPPDERKRQRLDGVFDAIGQRTLWLGEAGEGTRLKLVANAWVLTVVEGCAEIVALAQGLDLDPQLLLDSIEGGALDLPYLRTKTQAIVKEDWEPSFRLALAAKDAELMEESARSRGLELPLLAAIRKRMREAAVEHGEEDMIATYFASAPERTST